MEYSVVSIVKNYLDNYGRIIIISSDCEKDLVCRFLEFLNRHATDKSMTILMAQSLGFITSQIAISQITLEELLQIENLYMTYQFSSKVRLFGRSHNYGTLFNLADCNMISEDEVFKAFVC